jgi:hypothetical protein
VFLSDARGEMGRQFAGRVPGCQIFCRYRIVHKARVRRSVAPFIVVAHRLSRRVVLVTQPDRRPGGIAAALGRRRRLRSARAYATRDLSPETSHIRMPLPASCGFFAPPLNCCDRTPVAINTWLLVTPFILQSQVPTPQLLATAADLASRAWQAITGPNR